MNRLSLLALVCAIGLLLTVPALPQEEQPREDLGKRVEVLEEAVAAQQEQIGKLARTLATQKAEAAVLLTALQKAEKDGFLFPAPHNDAKKALLSGLQRFAASTAGRKLEPDAAASED